MSEEAYPEAAAILRDAGWKPHDGWNVYTRDTLVMGFQPDGQAFHVKNWAAIQEGHPQWSPETPDTAEEAATWLVAKFAPNLLAIDPEVADLLSTHLEPEHHPDLGVTLALQSEEVETPGDESNGETGEANNAAASEEADRVVFVHVDATGGDDPSYTGELSGPDDYVEERRADPGLVLDADFTIEDLGGPDEQLALEGADPEDFAPDEIEHPETSGGAFIFGDNLDQLRTAAIGRVIRYANGIMPRWLPEDDARLSELRNFVMGVSERRWDDNPANQAELNALETTIRRINEIKNARDTKVEFLEGASREEIEDFAVEANWP